MRLVHPATSRASPSNRAAELRSWIVLESRPNTVGAYCDKFCHGRRLRPQELVHNQPLTFFYSACDRLAHTEGCRVPLGQSETVPNFVPTTKPYRVSRSVGSGFQTCRKPRSTRLPYHTVTVG